MSAATHFVPVLEGDAQFLLEELLVCPVLVPPLTAGQAAHPWERVRHCLSRGFHMQGNNQQVAFQGLFDISRTQTAKQTPQDQCLFLAMGTGFCSWTQAGCSRQSVPQRSHKQHVVYWTGNCSAKLGKQQSLIQQDKLAVVNPAPPAGCW